MSWLSDLASSWGHEKKSYLSPHFNHFEACGPKESFCGFEEGSDKGCIGALSIGGMILKILLGG